MDDPESTIDKSMLEANTDSLEPNLDPEPEPELEQGQEPDPEPEEEPGAKEDMLGACSSNNDCPPTDPVCSEFGFCQCECYKPGDMECWGKGETVCGGGVDQPEVEETNEKEQDNEVVENEMAQDSEDKELKETDDNYPESDEAVEEVQEEEGDETAVSEAGGAV
jgi:hypothetical protein